VLKAHVLSRHFSIEGASVGTAATTANKADVGTYAVGNANSLEVSWLEAADSCWKVARQKC